MNEMYEQLILTRLKDDISKKGGLAENQFGFISGKTTLDAIDRVMGVAAMARRSTLAYRDICACVTLDVKNAFNSAPWRRILAELERWEIQPYLLAVCRDYLRDRRIRLCDGTMLEVASGVPQGSVVGPVLWNILYDGVLRLELREGAQLVGYADDLALVVTARKERELVEITNDSLRRISAWLEDSGLELATHKTEVALLVGKKRVGDVEFTLGEAKVRSQKYLKYLGVYLDRGMTYGPHVGMTAVKAETVVQSMCKIMPNVGGARASKRRAMASVVNSVLLYGSEIWGGHEGGKTRGKTK